MSVKQMTSCAFPLRADTGTCPAVPLPLQLQLKLTRWCKKDTVPLRVYFFMGSNNIILDCFCVLTMDIPEQTFHVRLSML